MPKNEASIILDENSPDIVDDSESKYEGWDKFLEAIAEEREELPENVKMPSKRKEYEFDVDRALDTIDLSFPNYIPSLQAIEFFNVIRLVLGKEPEVKNSKMHYFLVDLVFGNVTEEMFPFPKEITKNLKINPKKIAIIASRRSAKSTILTAFMPIYVAITGKIPNFGKVMFWVSFGDAQHAGAKVQANTIRDLCMDSEFCKGYFEKMRFTDEECEFIRRGDGREEDRAFMFKVKGASGSSVRGIRYRAKRIDILSFDDIIKSEADARSAVIMQKLNSMIYSDAESAMNRNGKLIIINTPFTKKDPVYSALENGVWTPMCVPMCEKINEGTTKEEFVGSWPQMNDYDWAMERYLDAKYGGTLREFNQELMLRIASEEDKLIKKGEIQWYSRQNILKHLSGYKVFATTDYTASNSKKGDYSGTALWAMNSVGDIFLLELSLKKDGIAEQFEHIFRFVQMYTVKYGVDFVEVGVEINGQQQLNIESLRKDMQARNVYFTFARQVGKPYGSEGVSRSGRNKHNHFMRVHPLFQGHHIYFPEELADTPDMKELLEELGGITYTGLTAKCFSGDTNIMTPNGYKKAHDLQCNDTVYSFDGIMSIPVTITNIIDNGVKLTYEVHTEDTTLYLTGDHKVLTTEGYKQVLDLAPGDKIIKDNKWQLLNVMVPHGETMEEDIINQHVVSVEKGSGYIGILMSKKEAQYLKECMYTTKTMTKLITRLIIWKYLLILNIKKYMLKIKTITYIKRQSQLITQKCRDWLNSLRKVSILGNEDVDNLRKGKKKGYVRSAVKRLYSKIQIKMVLSTAQGYVAHVVEKLQQKRISLKALYGYVNPVIQSLNLKQLITYSVPKSVSTLLGSAKQKLENVNSVKMNSKLVESEKQSSAQQNVLQRINSQDTLTLVKSAILYLQHLDQRIVAAIDVDTSTVNRINPRYEENVYDITVSSNSCFLVDNGLVIHNCDDGVDLVSMIPLLDLQKPSAEDMLSTELDVVEQGHDGNWYYPEDTNEWGSGGGSTVF